MDDGDGALAIEMMAGQPQQALLQTIYNGSASCQACGMLMNPVAAMYGGTTCPDCQTQKNARQVNDLMGGTNGR